VKTLIELQNRRAKLAQIAFQLEEAMKMAKSKYQLKITIALMNKFHKTLPCR
jgi:hypothetical protein